MKKKILVFLFVLGAISTSLAASDASECWDHPNSDCGNINGMNVCFEGGENVCKK